MVGEPSDTLKEQPNLETLFRLVSAPEGHKHDEPPPEDTKRVIKFIPSQYHIAAQFLRGRKLRWKVGSIRYDMWYYFDGTMPVLELTKSREQTETRERK